MSRDAGGGPAKRPRALERAGVGWPRALQELKDLLYEVYLAAGAPSLDVMAAEIAADDTGLGGAPSRDTVRRCISGPGLPPGQADAVAVASVLARHAAWEREELAARVRELWVEARMATGKGRLIEEFDDHLVLASLEVKPALDAGTARARFGVLPSYVPRALDGDLETLVNAVKAGRSSIGVLVGGSSTGKTRAMWEAVRRLPDGWRLWHPLAPSRPEALLAELPDVAPRTVVWLNEAQLYLRPDPFGEQVAAGLRSLLYDPRRGPVLVLATLWPEHWDTLTARTEPDRHSHARELLRGHRIHVPDAFTEAELSSLPAVARSDPRLLEAAELAPDGQITQYLAGVPVLTERYQAARGATKHLIHAAMDARRLGAGPAVPLAWLADAVLGYFTDSEWNAAGDWLPQALGHVTQECNGIPGILTPVRTGTPRNQRKTRGSRTNGTGSGHLAPDTPGPHYQLADYLEQYGRRHRADQVPPIDFWTAAAAHALPADLYSLGRAAEERKLYRDAAQLYKRATSHGDSDAPGSLVSLFRSLVPGDRRPAQWVAEHVNLSDPSAVSSVLDDMKAAGADEQIAALLARDPASHVDLGNSDAVAYLIEMLAMAGADEQMAVLLSRAPAAHVDLHNCVDVAFLLDSLSTVGAEEQVAALLARDPAGHVDLHNPYNLYLLIESFAAAGATAQTAALLARDPAARVSLHHPYEVVLLLLTLRKAGAGTGACEQALALSSRAAVHADISSSFEVNLFLDDLARAGLTEQAKTLAVRAAAHVSLENAKNVRELLEHLNGSWPEQHAALAARAPAGISLDDLHEVGKLVENLRHAGMEAHAMELATRVAAGAPLDDPIQAAKLMSCLRRAGAEEQAVTLQARVDTHAARNDQSSTAWRLASKIVTELGPDVDDPDVAGHLIEMMAAAGLDKEVAAITPYLPVTDGLMRLGRSRGHLPRSPFGWEPDGSAASPWEWTDLD